jgi:hypothetical protein
MADPALDRQQLKKGSAELLILATLEDRPPRLRRLCHRVP